MAVAAEVGFIKRTIKVHYSGCFKTGANVSLGVPIARELRQGPHLKTSQGKLHNAATGGQTSHQQVPIRPHHAAQVTCTCMHVQQAPATVAKHVQMTAIMCPRADLTA